tara:strand:+ start:28 stop:465 length:438 start_codon:yes stop_codon:yes gene_type:complete
MTISAGRPTRNESLVPPKVFTALALVATGTSFDKAAETVSMTGKALRKWRSHKDVKDYLEEIPRENIDIGTNFLSSRNHLYMQKLDEIIMNPTTSDYNRIDAIKAAHMIQKENVLDRQQNRKLNEIREILLEKDSGRSLIDITDN